jgi:hypothetical protein
MLFRKFCGIICQIISQNNLLKGLPKGLPIHFAIELVVALAGDIDEGHTAELVVILPEP